jgi:hypothetical protein
MPAPQARSRGTVIAPDPRSNSAAAVNPPAITDTCGLARPSLIRSLIQLRPETFGAHRTEQAAEVTDSLDLRWTQPHKLGKRVGGNPGATPGQPLASSNLASSATLTSQDAASPSMSYGKSGIVARTAGLLMNSSQFVKYIADHAELKPSVTFEAYGFRESSSRRIAGTFPRGQAFIFPDYFAFLSTRHQGPGTRDQGPGTRDQGSIQFFEESGLMFGQGFGNFFLKLLPYHAGTAVNIAKALGGKYKEPRIVERALTNPVSFFFPLSDLTNVVSGGGGWASDGRDAGRAPYFRLVTPGQTYLVQMAPRLAPSPGNMARNLRQSRDWQPRALELLQAAVARNRAVG